MKTVTISRDIVINGSITLLAFNCVYGVCSLMSRGGMCQGRCIRSSLHVLVVVEGVWILVRWFGGIPIQAVL